MMKTLRTYLINLKKINLSFLLVGLILFSFSSFIDFQDSNAQIRVVKCYPNPATSYVNFDFQKNIDRTYTLQVYSFSGRKMTEMPASNNTVTVMLTDFYRGIYVYELRDKEGKIVESGKFQVVK
jgi:hypothetical protein